MTNFLIFSSCFRACFFKTRFSSYILKNVSSISSRLHFDTVPRCCVIFLAKRSEKLSNHDQIVLSNAVGQYTKYLLQTTSSKQHGHGAINTSISKRCSGKGFNKFLKKFLFSICPFLVKFVNRLPSKI